MHVLNKETVTGLKGVAIVMIVFHNYFHLIFDKTKENEIDFDPSRFSYFLNEFLFAPHEWVQAVFTYFGHFGVQIFIFLSAYALAISYSSGGIAFFLSRIKKLYPTFIAAMGLWLALGALLMAVLVSKGDGDSGSIDIVAPLMKVGGELLALLLGIFSFIPGNVYPIVGPWWFIAYIIQFYLFWALLGNYLCQSDKKTMIFLMCLALLVSSLVVPGVLIAANVNLLLTVFGHLPEIVAAVYAVKYGFPRPFVALGIAIPILCLSGLYNSLYAFHHISALVVFLSLAMFIVKHLGGTTKRVIDWIGKYSLPLFLVNGFLRVPFGQAAIHFNSWWVDMVSAIVFFGVSCLVAYGLTWTVNRLQGANKLPTNS